MIAKYFVHSSSEILIITMQMKIMNIMERNINLNKYLAKHRQESMNFYHDWNIELNSLRNQSSVEIAIE